MAFTGMSVPFAGETRKPTSLSPTSASAWTQCQLKYAMTYLAGWVEPSTLPQFIGNVTHRAVEMLYGNAQSERSRGVASELLRVALAEELDSPAYMDIREQSNLSESVLSSGEDALDGLFELENPAELTVDAAGLEIWVNAELYGAPIRGRIDRLYDARGAEVVADYKTGRVPKPAYTEKAFFGLWTYAAGLAAADPDHRLADRIELLYLAGRERLSRPVLRSVALDHARALASIWRSISQATDRGEFTAQRSRLCGWCAFQPACPVFSDVPAPGSSGHDALLGQQGLRRRGQIALEDNRERLHSTTAIEELSL